MNIYFYSAGQTVSSLRFLSRLRNQLECIGSGGQRHNVEEIDSERGFMLRSGDLVIVFAGTSDELDAIVGRSEVFAGCRVILVLPDSESDTLHKGYLIRPRFIEYKDNDHEMLAAVVCKMAATTEGAPFSFGGAVSYA